MRALWRRSLPAALAGLLIAGTALAEPHTRNGLCLGLGFGLQSVSWSDANGDRNVEGSGTGNARAGYAIRPDLVLGLEFWGWAKEYEIGIDTLSVPVHIRLTATTVGVTYFPGNTGFYMRLGAGIAYGRAEVSAPPSVDVAAAGVETDTGIAVALAPGYEWRLTPKFALGGQMDLVYLGLSGALENAFGYGVNAQFNWYW
jgi:hypothetical protein